MNEVKTTEELITSQEELLADYNQTIDALGKFYNEQLPTVENVEVLDELLGMIDHLTNLRDELQATVTED